MYALNSITSDLELKIEQKRDYQVHQFFYKGLLIRTLHWRPANYTDNGYTCDLCTSGPCCVCILNRSNPEFTTQTNSCNLQIAAYQNRLFQVEPCEFRCYISYIITVLEVQGNILAKFYHDGWLWEGTLARRNDMLAHSAKSFQIFDDRLEVNTKYKTIVLYNHHPLHKQILAKLRELRPFSEAPVWF